jgi:hypothetical protein
MIHILILLLNQRLIRYSCVFLPSVVDCKSVRMLQWWRKCWQIFYLFDFSINLTFCDYPRARYGAHVTSALQLWNMVRLLEATCVNTAYSFGSLKFVQIRNCSPFQWQLIERYPSEQNWLNIHHFNQFCQEQVIRLNIHHRLSWGSYAETDCWVAPHTTPRCVSVSSR